MYIFLGLDVTIILGNLDLNLAPYNSVPYTGFYPSNRDVERVFTLQTLLR